jgi:hypothetical protein
MKCRRTRCGNQSSVAGTKGNIAILLLNAERQSIGNKN